MKFNIQFYEKLSIRVFAIFSIAIFATFIPEYLHDFFGDWYCSGSGAYISEGGWSGRFSNCNYGDLGIHDATWHWGFRHWLWFIMCLTLFIINAIRIIEFINKKPC